MDTVIEKISEIEAAAAAIMDEANDQKKEIARKMQERTAGFDSQLECETKEEIEKLRAAMEIEMKERLKKQREDCRQILKAMEKRYQEHHAQYVKELFKKMVKE